MFERIGPYHAARLRAAAKICQLTAIEVQRTDETYAWDQMSQVGFSRITLYESATDRCGLRDLRRQIDAKLAASTPDAVAIHGWSEPAALLALRWCQSHGVPAIVMSESSERDAPRSRLGEWMKRQVVRHYSAGLVGGRDHRDYLGKLGIPPERCFLGYDVVDNAYFESAAAVIRQDSERMRQRLDLPHRYFLACCRFINKKNVARLIDAYAQYRRGCGEAAWDLVILGDGPLRDQIAARIDSRGLTEHLHLPGFRQYAELPNYYAMASVFVHASTVEQWGLVVNEAMACGLPVIVSDRCGCAVELVDKSNGWTFDPYNVNELSNCLAEATLRENSELKPMGIASLNKIASWSPHLFAASLNSAALNAVSVRVKPQSRLNRLLLDALIRLHKKKPDDPMLP